MDNKSRWAFLEKFVIGKQNNPMMKRIRVVQTPWFGVYIHHIYREDQDLVPHNHPWKFMRMVLRGGYDELFYENPRTVIDHESEEYDRRVRRFRPSWAPRLLTGSPQSTRTLSA